MAVTGKPATRLRSLRVALGCAAFLVVGYVLMSAILPADEDWVVLVGVLVIVWRVAAVMAVVVGLFQLVAAIVGPEAAARWHRRFADDEPPPAPDPVAGGELIVEPVESDGLLIDLQYPRSVELYATAHPHVRIDGEVRKLTWGEHTLPVGPGTYQLDVVVVAYDAPLHTTGASGQVKVPRQRGVAVTYIAPEI